MQQVGACRVAEEPLDAETAHGLDGVQIVIKHGGAETGQHQQPVHDLTEAADADDDDRLLLVDLVILGVIGGVMGHPVLQSLIGDEGQRRQQHRQRDHKQHPLGQARIQHPGLQGERDQHEAEFACLGKAKREQPAVAPLDAEDQRQDIKDDALDQHEKQGRAEKLERIAEESGEIDARADRDEEQPQEQTLERGDVAFKFVPELAVGQHHAGKEGAKCGRKADKRHQEGDADDDEKREGGVHLAQLGEMHEAEQRARGVDAEKNDQGDGTEGDQRQTPGRQRGDEVHQHLGAAVVTVAVIVRRHLDAGAQDRPVRAK